VWVFLLITLALYFVTWLLWWVLIPVVLLLLNPLFALAYAIISGLLFLLSFIYSVKATMASGEVVTGGIFAMMLPTPNIAFFLASILVPKSAVGFFLAGVAEIDPSRSNDLQQAHSVTCHTLGTTSARWRRSFVVHNA